MGLNKEQDRGVKYLSIFDGKLVERSKIEKEGFEQLTVTNKNGTFTAFVCEYDSLEGEVVSLDYVVNEYEGQKIQKWNIGVYDVDNFVLSIDANGSLTRDLMKILPNVNFDWPSKIQVIKDRETKKPKLLISQNGVYLKHAFTKDSQNGLPQPVITKKGDLDFTSQNDFLHEIGLDVSAMLVSKRVSRQIEDTHNETPFTDSIFRDAE